MRYSPRSLVTLPTVVPAMNTCAPGSGRPEPVSVTFPSIVPVAWAAPSVANARTNADAARNMLLQRTLLMRPSHGDEVTADHKHETRSAETPRGIGHALKSQRSTIAVRMACEFG